ncbi:ABC transporter permease [Parabacteroides faecis]|uniref:ABC transport system permease protein n=1 Tax=Parabacteroides faecis TaxID=1217282 RepID=A0ABR6KPG6_9BACT|nr:MULTISPECIES: ABC transporter permease [Parabacteroides]MBB4623243.1 putative ABC transport system permease protein [Parabacteroides faecis]MBC8617265.1 ABC transporter permease [Parabacteroides faecis]RHS01201.1 ABC transporter permease [Parabacteroides sp. AF14-59]GGJ99229.1 ABC transporter permease [Parabacteroides faecis]
MKTIIRNFISVLRRFKMATILNILGLSVAFAAFMVIMMQVDYDKNFDTFHKNADNIYRVEFQWDKESTQAVLSRPMANVFMNFSPHIVAGAVTSPFYNETFYSVDKGVEKSTYMEPTMIVDPSFTDVFDFDILDGSVDALKEPGKVLVPESLARKIFGEESAVGKQITAKESKGLLVGFFTTPEGNYTIGGIYKDLPLNSIIRNAIFLKMDEKADLHNWGNSSYNFYVRLDHPESAKDLVSDFLVYYKKNELGKNMSWYSGEPNFRLTRLPDVHYATDVTFDMTPKSSRQTVLVLIAISLVILIIAGINFTNFSTALTPMRVKSINTQKVLGSSDGVLRFSLLMEAVCISTVAYLLALWMVHMAGNSTIAKLVDADMSLFAHPLLLSATALIALLTGLLAGLYPSYYMTSFSPALVLKGSFGLSPAGRRLRNVLICIQFIVSFTLIIGSMFMSLQNRFMQNSPLGYDKDQIIVTNLTAPVLKSSDAFRSSLKTFSGIEDVTYGEFMLSSQDQYMEWGRELKGENIQFQCMPIDPSFLKVMNIPVTEGRDFREEDALTAEGAFIFNERARNLYDISLGDKIDGANIVGFIPDIKFASFRTEVTPMAFYVRGKGYGGGADYAYIKVKGDSNLQAAMAHVKSVLNEIHPDYPFNVKFFDQVLNTLYEKEENLSSLITLFSLIAVFISMVGVFGLVVFDSQYRKKEIGIRKIMGSTTSEILIMFNKTYIYILCICFALAAPVAYYAIHKWLENFALKTPVYWWVFMLAFLLVFCLTILTVTFQNWRVANENPVYSIKDN